MTENPTDTFAREKDRFDQIEGRILGAASPGIRPGLSRMARLCRALGHPERTFAAIHVLGTNGKGSVCAALDSILRESGYRTARYTSPHLDHIGERLTFDGKTLDPKAWEEALARVLAAIRNDPLLCEDPPSVFEILTALAFLLISRGERDIAIIEAGLGGRLDATNLLGDVRMTVLTPIGLDHQDILGLGIERIALEKISAMRPGVEIVGPELDGSLSDLVESRAKRLGNLFSALGRDAFLESSVSGLQGSTFNLSRPGQPPIRLTTPLLGNHQVGNAGLAALACLRLSSRWPRITMESIGRGLEKTSWPGRLERIPLDPPVLLDGAHNPHGAEALSRALRGLWPNVRPNIVMAVMKDKDIDGILEALSKIGGGGLFCTEIQGLDRCKEAAGLAAEAIALPWPGPVKAIPDPGEALTEAMREAPLVVCTGSLYFIGSIRRLLLERVRG